MIGTNVRTGAEETFPNIASVCDYGFKRSGVYKVLTGEMITHGGYRWRYADGLPHRELSDEWKQKLTKPRTRGIAVSRPVIGTKISDGTEIRFEYIAEAARALDCHASAISNCLSGRFPSCAGYRWRLA